jgi:hypothetical protein
MKQLKMIDVKSVFRVSLILGALLGVIAGIIFCIGDMMDQRVGEGLAMLFLGPLLYGVVGALLNAFVAKMYNLIAARWGGIQLTIE